MNRHEGVLGLMLFLSALLSSCSGSSSYTVDKEDNGESISDNAEDVTNDVLNVHEYVEWIQDPKNGIRKEKSIGDLNFVVQFKPIEYMVCIEERDEKIYDTLLQSRKKELKEMQYFDLKIILNRHEGELLKYNLSSMDQYDQRVKYFAYEMQNDIELVDGIDTLPCVLYHFERTYDVAPYCTILVGFEAKENNIQNQKTFLFHDRTFNKGLLKFTFKDNSLKNLPKLETI